MEREPTPKILEYALRKKGQLISPLNLFQERYASDPWAVLCCAICLNLCTGRAFESVHHDLFALWPTPLHMATANSEDLRCLLSQLGLQNRRTVSLIRMSTAYACLWDGSDPADLPGIGKYGSDSYRIFVRGQLDVGPTDKELRKYLEWIKS
jgi:endonuclease III